VLTFSDAWLERRGSKRGVTYHLSREAAAAFHGKAAYTRGRGIDAVRWPELIRAYAEQHGSISNRECRDLLGLGNSPAAVTRASRLLAQQQWLAPYGDAPRARRYRLREAQV
jgi:ATP-dependent DNA helicase RecG